MPEYTKVRAGDSLSIPAATYNAFIDAATYVKGQTTGSTGGLNPLKDQNSGVVTVQNKSGVFAERFSALQVSAPTILPSENEDAFKNRIVLNLAVADDAGSGRWVVIQQPLDLDKIGTAVAIGVTLAVVNVLDIADTFVEVEAGNAILQSGTSGSAQILWLAGGAGTATATGEQLAVIKLGGGSGGGIPQGLYEGQVLICPANNSDLVLDFPFLHST